MNKSSKKTIFLTGKTGFIGKNLLEFLIPKYEVVAPTHQELELLNEDAVRRFFQNNSIDIVLHCAVRPGHRAAKDPSNQLNHNLRMFFNIFRNADKFKKMIFFSSGLVYDIRYYVPKMKEEYFNTHVPNDEGGLSRYIIAKYIEQVDNIIELRPFGVFGKHEEVSIRFISNAIYKTIFDLPITIKQNRRFDYIYINDLIEIVDYFIQHEVAYKAYNVTPDASIELIDIAKKVLKISGKDLPIIVAREGLGTEYSGDNSRLHKEIPNIAFTPIDTAISELYEWYVENKHLINRELLLVDK